LKEHVGHMLCLKAWNKLTRIQWTSSRKGTSKETKICIWSFRVSQLSSLSL